MSVDLARALLDALDDDALDVLAERLAPRLAVPVGEPAAPERLLTVDALADLLGVSADWVRRHQDELGAYRLTDGGGRNPIRFRVSEVERFLRERRLSPPAGARVGWRDDPDWSMG